MIHATVNAIFKAGGSDKMSGRAMIDGSSALLMLPLAFNRSFRRRAAKLSRAGKWLMALLALAAASTLTACGGGGFFSHGTQSYTVTVTAVSGPDTHTATVTLTVQ